MSLSGRAEELYEQVYMDALFLQDHHRNICYWTADMKFSHGKFFMYFLPNFSSI